MARPSSHDVQERLLAAGVQTLSRSGFNGCSVQDITDAAGVPKGSFYNHFESKEAFAVAALAHSWAEGSPQWRRILTDPDVPPRERLRSYFAQANAKVAAMGYTCGCFFGNMAAELSDQSPIIANQLSEIFASWSQSVGECIRDAQQVGAITSDADPDQLAAFVLNAWEGAVLRARIEKGDRPLRQFFDTLFTVLLR